MLREKLQRQADIEARAQAALAQLSASCGVSVQNALQCSKRAQCVAAYSWLSGR